MNSRRVCDACSVRRVKCDGEDPCSRCLGSSLECIRRRPRQKMGPKGIRKKTLDRLAATIETNPINESGQLDARPADANHVSADQRSPHVRSVGKTATDTLVLYLDIYNHKMFAVWPVVDINVLVRRLNDPEPDFEAYMLAVSVCAATILQLQLAMDAGGTLTAHEMIDEIEQLRHMRGYRQNPSMDALRTSFFMHVSYLHVGQRMSSTLLLKEAISMAHLLGLHNASYYADLSHAEEQIGWDLRQRLLVESKLMINRAHTSQYDIPSTVTIPSCLPPLDSTNQDFSLDAFALLCNMFAHFSQAFDNPTPTTMSLSALDNSLQNLPMLSRHHNTIQRADALVTRQWMRLSLWKLAVSRVAMSVGPSESLDSILFPIQATRDLLATISQLSIDSLEAHGPGMELKLFEFANSLTDVITCLPGQSNTSMSTLGPKDSLLHLATILGRFRGGNHALMPILQARLGDVGLGVPSIPRVVDVSGESNESDYTESSPGRNEAETPRLDGTNDSLPQPLPWPWDVEENALLLPTHLVEQAD